MTLRHSASSLLPAAALLFAVAACSAQNPLQAPAPALKQHPKPVDPNAPPPVPDRSQAYFHEGLAHLYEELAVANGRPDFAAQAVEEYKLALNADPNSTYLQDGLSELYFKIGRIREAVNAAMDQVKKNPDDIAAHTLLGKVYLRSLGDTQSAQSTQMLEHAITEYQTLARLKPKDLETHLLLGQLYSLNHDNSKAETEFRIAQTLDANSEDAVLNIARLYSDQGDAHRAIDALKSIAPDDRDARADFALGSSYDQLKDTKNAIAAYRAALEDQPDDVETLRALAIDLLSTNQLAEALPVFQEIVAVDPSDAESVLKVSEVQRRLGKYDDALVTLQKAEKMNGSADNPELSFNEAVLYDALGKYDESVTALKHILTTTEKPGGAYADPEKNNRYVFLDRLAIVYREQNKTPEAVDAYKQMIALGGDYRSRGYQGEVDAYRDAHQFKDAVAAAQEAAQALPDDRDIQLLYAFQLADTGQADQGIALARKQLVGTLASPKPEDRDALIQLSNIDLRLHHSAEALALLDKTDALSTKPGDQMYVDLLRATIYDHDKNFEQAEAQYKKALAFDPNNATILNDLGFLYADHNVKLQEALTMIKKAVELDPQNGAYLDSLGWVYFKLGQYGPAEENLHKAIDRTSTDASIHDHLADVYEKTGRLKLAVNQWERSMQEYASSLPADADPADIAKVKHKLEDARTKLAKLSTAPGKKS